MDSPFILSRIITELIFPGISAYFSRLKFHPSYSSIEPARSRCIADYILKIRRLKETINIQISISGASGINKEKIYQALNKSAKDTAFILQVISGREIRGAEITEALSGNEEKQHLYQYTIALRKDSGEIIITVDLDPRFFNILIPSLDTTLPDFNIAETLTLFFKKPGILVPSIRVLLEKLDSKELSEIFEIMKRKNELSDYQLVLLINGFPENSLKIKNSLSKNGQASLREELDKYRGKVTREDISCGIYSVEESLGQVLKKGENRFSEYFTILSDLVKKISDYELYFRKGWDLWIEEISGKNLLYKTLLKCDDNIIRDAFSDYTHEKYRFFDKFFTPERIDEIFSSYACKYRSDITDARIEFIKKYRALLVSLFRSGNEHFSLLISSIQEKKDFEIILRQTGWFILSTALKQSNRKLQDKVTENISYPASALIKGVISGTINPDILHDEVQVNRARNECVRIILGLFEDGIIEPEI